MKAFGVEPVVFAVEAVPLAGLYPVTGAPELALAGDVPGVVVLRPGAVFISPTGVGVGAALVAAVPDEDMRYSEIKWGTRRRRFQFVRYEPEMTSPAGEDNA